MNDIEKLIALIKKYGIGLILFVLFLWQYLQVVKDKDRMIEVYQNSLKDNISIMIKIDESLKRIPLINDEIRELRFEQRRLNDIMQLPSKRYSKES